MIRLIDLLKEAKQVGILYHYTIYENAVDILKDSNLKSGMSDDKFQKQVGEICELTFFFNGC